MANVQNGNDQLTGPFALFKDGDDDTLYFETLLEILEDRDTILLGERYIGYDVRGTRFDLHRVSHRRPRLFGLMTKETSVLEVAHVDRGTFAAEARSRIAAWLREAAEEHYGTDEAHWPPQARRTYAVAALEALSLDELLRLGLEWAQDEPQA